MRNSEAAHSQEPPDLRRHPLQGVSAVCAAIGSLVDALRHQDVPVLVDGVRLGGLRHELVDGVREYADVALRVLRDPLQELVIRILVLHKHKKKKIPRPKNNIRLFASQNNCRSGGDGGFRDSVRGTGRPARSGPRGSSGSRHLAGVGTQQKNSKFSNYSNKSVENKEIQILNR